MTLTQSKAIDHLQTDTYDGAYIEDLAASGNLSDYGADGAGTGSVVTYELILDSAYTEGTPSGLTMEECRSVCMSQAECSRDRRH
ncbi:hypothetical protein MY494_02945 [Synechococcus sp. A10-1-5-1]|uniref:hypothetical protein n=1 Tax=Synechococcus sp. A10-1-5-1 TaxID=2936507 RepID=UPI002000B6B8|nr:hypothetical protein [Synechococcus sp. A10-1-5-1]UPM50757.1 hypothetical protein MY494_02945 [Synechococcus sp. A10-1-5-1]